MTITTISIYRLKEGMPIEETQEQIAGYGAKYNYLQADVRRYDACFRPRISEY